MHASHDEKKHCSPRLSKPANTSDRSVTSNTRNQMQTGIRQNCNVYSGESRKPGNQDCTVQNHKAEELLIVSIKVKTRYQSYVSTDKG